MKRTTLILSMAAIALAFASCTKDSESPTTTTATTRIATMVEHKGSDVETNTFQYDGKGRLISQKINIDEVVLDVSYEVGKVIVKRKGIEGAGKYHEDISTYTLNDKGLAISDNLICLRNNDDNMNSLMTYDSDKYLTHRTTSDKYYAYVDDFTISNGNILTYTSKESKNSASANSTKYPQSILLPHTYSLDLGIRKPTATKSASISTTTYQYYTDKANTMGVENMGVEFLGKQSQNLIKSETKNGTAKNYTYEFDSKGRVTKKICDDGWFTTYTYVE